MNIIPPERADPLSSVKETPFIGDPVFEYSIVASHQSMVLRIFFLLNSQKNLPNFPLFEARSREPPDALFR